MIYKIAGILVDMNPQYPKMINQSRPYLADNEKKAYLRISSSKECVDYYRKEYNLESDESGEYMFFGAEFYHCLIEFGGFMLHSSAVVHNGKAYLFSAPSGTGKSTHTQLWVKHFDDAYILNDDKPAIRVINGKFYVYGTPFSGKTNLNVNTCVPLGGICVLERAEKNSIRKLSPAEAMFGIMDQTVRPIDEEKMDKLLKMIDLLIEDGKIYKLCCNMDEEACVVSYNGMKGEE